MGTVGVVGLLQLLGLLLIIPLVLLKPRFGSRIFERVERRLEILAEQPRRQLWAVGLLCLAVRGALLPWFPPPPPYITDEFSLLFQAELIASWRWAAPPDPMWRHFEEMHVIAWPSYASIYFPGRSVLPALGILLGHYWIGLWLGMAALCAAITWMLQGFVRAPYALLGGLLTVLNFGIFSYWANGLWGGTITALGATLVLGAIARLLERPRWRDGALAGVGTLLMLTSRPFDSMFFCLGVAIALVPWLVRSLRGGGFRPVAMLAAPVALFALLGAGILMSHSAAITGDPLKTAYQLSRETYAIAPATLLSPPLPTKQWVDARMERVYRSEAQGHANRDSLPAMLAMLSRRLVNLASFFVGPAMSLPFLLGLAVLVRRWAWTVLPAAAVVGAYLITSWDFPHYASQLLPISMLAIVAGFGSLRHVHWSYRPIGIDFSRLLPILLLFNLAVPLSWAATGWPTRTHNHWNQACCVVKATSERVQVEQRLLRLPGQDLVFIRYSPRSPLFANWVFNRPDYARAPIIWARYRNERENRALAARYPGRRIWIVQPLGGLQGSKLYRGLDGALTTL